MHKTPISEMSWYEFRDAMAFNDLIIIPVGSNEEHGPHNPLGTDTILARELARRIGEQAGVPVAPEIPIGSTHNLAAFPGTVNVDPMLLRKVVFEIAESYVLHGARRFLFVNGHGGNSNSLDFVCDDLHAKYNDVIAMHSEWWKVLPFISQYKCDDHGGKHETSFVLDVDPDLCHMERAKTVPRASLTERLTYTDKFRFDGVNIPTCGVTLDKLTPMGNYGARAEEATAELGAEMSRIYVDYCVELVKELKRVYL